MSQFSPLLLELIFQNQNEYTPIVDLYVFDVAKKQLSCVLHRNLVHLGLNSFFFSAINELYILSVQNWCQYLIITLLENFQQRFFVIYLVSNFQWPVAPSVPWMTYSNRGNMFLFQIKKPNEFSWSINSWFFFISSHVQVIKTKTSFWL